MSGRQVVPGSAEMQGEGTQYRTASVGDEIGGRADAFHGALVHGGGEPGGPAHLDRELVEFRGLDLFGEQQRLLGQHGDRHTL